MTYDHALREDFTRAGALPAQQSRSRALRDRLVGEGLNLARQISFDDVSIADICNAAGCSTGAFYARFPDKISLFKAIMVASAAESRPMVESIVREASFELILIKLVEALIARFQAHQAFFRSAIKVTLDAGEAWEPFRRNSHALADAYLERLEAEPSVEFAKLDEARVRFAFQMMYGVLTDALIHRPGPFSLGSKELPVLLELSLRAAIGLDEARRS